MIEAISLWIEKKFETPKETLIHYTTEENFKKIRRTGPTGGLLFHSHDVLNYKDRNNHEGTVGFNIIYDKFKKENGDEFAQETIDFIKNFISYESISFSEMDSSALIQKYGNKKNYIKKSIIEDFVYNKNKNNPDDCAKIFSKVQYDEEKNIQIIDDFFDKFRTKDISSQDNNKFSYFLMGLSFIVPFMKLEFDKEEQECRIVKVCNRSILKLPPSVFAC